MKLKAILLILALLVGLIPSAVKAQTPEDAAHLSNAVTLLYAQTEDGGQRMLCTATAYKKLEAGYRFVSAAHCVAGEEDAEQKDQRFFVTPDTTGEKKFIPAKLLQAGDKNVGDDFAIFEVTTDVKFEVIPLGDDKLLKVGDRVLNVSSPLGLGKQYFEGYISSLTLDRPKLDAGEVVWHDVFLVEIGGGPGSSGSAIVSVKQQAIIGFLVGSFNNGRIGFIIIPVSQFKAFEAKVDSKIYKKTQKKFSFWNLFSLARGLSNVSA